MEEFLDHTPLTEEEALGLFPNGDYKSFVENMEIKVSKAGKKCFVATIRAINPANNMEKVFTTWLALPYMLKHAYDAAGLSDRYDKNRLSIRDLIGCKLISKIKIKKGNEQYPQPKNEICDFVVNPGIIQSASIIEPEFNDDVPF